MTTFSSVITDLKKRWEWGPLERSNVRSGGGCLNSSCNSHEDRNQSRHQNTEQRENQTAGDGLQGEAGDPDSPLLQTSSHCTTVRCFSVFMTADTR